MDTTQIPRTAVHPIAVRPLSLIPSAWLLLLKTMRLGFSLLWHPTTNTSSTISTLAFVNTQPPHHALPSVFPHHKYTLSTNHLTELPYRHKRLRKKLSLFVILCQHLGCCAIVVGRWYSRRRMDSTAYAYSHFSFQENFDHSTTEVRITLSDNTLGGGRIPMVRPPIDHQIS